MTFVYTVIVGVAAFCMFLVIIAFLLEMLLFFYEDPARLDDWEWDIKDGDEEP